MRILIAEDDPRIIEHVSAALRAAGFAVDHVGDGETAWFQADTESYAAIILDLGLPKLDGLSVLKRLRETGNKTPILILTARGSWKERVEGIDAGADDYLPKPYQTEELLARLRAIIRRAAGQASSVATLGDLTIDERQMRVSRQGVPIALAPLEYRLFMHLVRHRGRVCSQIELTEEVYAQDWERDSNAIEVLVKRVRKKVGESLIETRRGFGYLIPEEPA
ncbi:MAG: response regulator transcription factor [Hyphomicrobiaceae bacterium]|nr:response regulator transcription factor [Hyphomicrobiaceae bacterium]